MALVEMIRMAPLTLPFELQASVSKATFAKNTGKGSRASCEAHKPAFVFSSNPGCAAR